MEDKRWLEIERLIKRLNETAKLSQENAMPYISKELREEVKLNGPHNTGELNYSITQIINDYIKQWGLSYKKINDILGALEGAKLEFYRRVAAPYEEEKRAQNGDVYGSETEEIEKIPGKMEFPIEP